MGTSDFRFFSGHVAWEDSWTKNPRDWYRINTEARILSGMGALAEMLIGNHTGVYFRFEITLINVPFGTQPWEGSADGPIKFPYFGLLFTYKMPLGSGL